MTRHVGSTASEEGAPIPAAPQFGNGVGSTTLEDAPKIIKQVRQALRQTPWGDLNRYGIAVFFDAGDLVLEGQVPDVAIKKLSLEQAATVSSVGVIVDRIHVAPAERQTDAALMDQVSRALRSDPLLASEAIEIRIEDGVVTLDGEVPSLLHKRLAGMLAWWVPGCRDVVNGLGVDSPDEDTDEKLALALRWVLDRDPTVKGSAIRVSVHGRLVTLEGTVSTEAERRRAERDMWCVFGVDQVDNRLSLTASTS